MQTDDMRSQNRALHKSASRGKNRSWATFFTDRPYRLSRDTIRQAYGVSNGRVTDDVRDDVT